MLGVLEALRAAPKRGTAAAVDRELASVRAARRRGGRRTSG